MGTWAWSRLQQSRVFLDLHLLYLDNVVIALHISKRYEEPLHGINSKGSSIKALNGIQCEVAHPLSLNYGAPIASMDATICVSGGGTPYIGITKGFKFVKFLCFEYQANTFFMFSIFGWNMWKNEVSIKIHTDLPWGSSKTSLQLIHTLDLNLHPVWYLGELSAKRSSSDRFEIQWNISIC